MVDIEPEHVIRRSPCHSPHAGTARTPRPRTGRVTRRPRRRFVSPFRTIWCAATMAANSWPSCATRREPAAGLCDDSSAGRGPDSGVVQRGLGRDRPPYRCPRCALGTTGRARVALSSSADLPDTVFVKLQPFAAEQRKFLRQIGLGVAEARFYATVGNDFPVRAPRVWHADHDDSDGSFVMVLEDLQASGCRFITPADGDILEVASSLVDELAVLHASCRNKDLTWLRTPSGMRRKPEDAEMRRPASPVHRLGSRSVRRRDATGVHSDRGTLRGTLAGHRRLVQRGRAHPHPRRPPTAATSSSTGVARASSTGRWSACAPGFRDVAYFLCNSLPVETRRAEEFNLLARYLAALATQGVALDEQVAHEQYRLFSVYSWIAAASTAAMGSQWQPIDVSRAAMARTTRRSGISMPSACSKRV